MIHFFKKGQGTIYAVQKDQELNQDELTKLTWLFAQAEQVNTEEVKGKFVGPRATMITPWSTNAVEITQNMGIEGITRIEEFKGSVESFDPMLLQSYEGLNQEIFDINISPEPIQNIDDIAAYNIQEGLSLSEDEVHYLQELSQKLGRPLTDSEVFGFSQVNSEHCRHKIFNGTFVIDGEAKEESLFQMIKKTSKEHPNTIVSAYKDNVAFIEGPTVEQFAPAKPDVPSDYQVEQFDSVLSLKAETHNFPTTVEPFNGAATGSGGEIRDRLAGGIGSIPLAGTAVYMTSYSRLNENRPWEKAFEERDWLYQTPLDILIKASNGASDFGNKFGQPLVCGSLLTFEHVEGSDILGFDKVIMQAGGIGYGKKDMAIKNTPKKDDDIVILGGDNYRIGMGGAAVSSADTGELSSGLELNAVQRSNPEMQKRAANTIRALVESDHNPIVSIHDHGAGGHLNCLSELVEETGGQIDLDKLPIGDPTLSAKEIIGNESQERMGLVIGSKDLELLNRIADRERTPIYQVGKVTDDERFSFESSKSGQRPMDLNLSDMFGNNPKTIMEDQTRDRQFQAVDYNIDNLQDHIRSVLKLEAVACKDWLTNKVDRCVGGKVAIQQCVGPLQLPLNNCAVMALDFNSNLGIATSIGHAPVSGLIDAAAGARNAIAESLTNIVWAPLSDGIRSVSLSANWMWPCRNPGEDARLYEAVSAVSQFAIDLGINIPTGKDSLSMAQKYGDKTVLAPGTVVISAAGECADLTQVVTPLFQKDAGAVYYIDMSSALLSVGGSSFAQVRNAIGTDSPDISDAAYFKLCFESIQEAIQAGHIVAGHDISAGGMITTLLEMCFSDVDLGVDVDFSGLSESDLIKVLFAENAGVIVQAKNDELLKFMESRGVNIKLIGQVTSSDAFNIYQKKDHHSYKVSELRDEWYETSYLLDQHQTANDLAKDRYDNYKHQPLKYQFPEGFSGDMPNIIIKNKPQAAIIREKGSNSEREMANALYRSGFAVRDVHMTDLVSGREDLSDVRFLGAVGGFSNSDVLGSAKGWAGAFKYNERANKALTSFFAREDTLSVGICNGCQLLLELDLINPEHEQLAKMTYNNSRKHESAFTSVKIQENNSIMLNGLAGAELGVWISHGEGKFSLPMPEDHYDIVAKYSYDAYPSNPNGSDYNTAMICSPDGRHLATMPHIERSYYAWNWAHYQTGRNDKTSPWSLAFRDAFEWVNG